MVWVGCGSHVGSHAAGSCVGGVGGSFREPTPPRPHPADTSKQKICNPHPHVRTSDGRVDEWAGYTATDYERDAGLDPLDGSPSTPASPAPAREGQGGSSSTCLCTRADYACSSPLCPGRRLLGEQGSGVSPAPIAAKSRGVADDVSLSRHRPLYGTYYEGGAGEPAAGQHVALVTSSCPALTCGGGRPRGAFTIGPRVLVSTRCDEARSLAYLKAGQTEGNRGPTS